MMMTYYMLHLVVIDQINSAYTDRALTYQIKESNFYIQIILLRAKLIEQISCGY
jgi:hypothetical protein